MQATITLGGQDYTIEELPSRKNKPWKGTMRADIKPIVDRLLGLRKLSFENTEQLAALASEMLMPMLAEVDDALEALLELVITYSPVIEADRERVEETARDSEIAKAFLEVLKLAYPLGELMTLVQTIAG